MTAESMAEWLPFAAFVVDVVIAVATVVALLLVYREFKEMKSQSLSLEKSIQASTYQAVLDSERALTHELSEDAGFLRKYLASLNLEIPDTAPAHIRLICAATAFNENLFFQHEQGAVPDSVWPAWRRFMKDLYSGPFVRPVWPHVKHWYYDTFVGYVDQLLAEYDREQTVVEDDHETIPGPT